MQHMLNPMGQALAAQLASGMGFQYPWTQRPAPLMKFGLCFRVPIMAKDVNPNSFKERVTSWVLAHGVTVIDFNGTSDTGVMVLEMEKSAGVDFFIFLNNCAEDYTSQGQYPIILRNAASGEDPTHLQRGGVMLSAGHMQAAPH